MRLKRNDDGLTLVEVIITVALLAIIIVPLTNAVIVYLRNTDATNERLAASHDAQIAAAYFAQDVQSIGVRNWATAPYDFKTSVEQNVAHTGGVNPCPPPAGSAAPPVALLRLAWDDPNVAVGQPPKVAVSYVYVTAGGVRELHRWRCVNSVLQDVAVLAHNLESQPTPSCPTLCTGLPLPQSISMPLNIKVPGSTNATLTVTLVGQRRQQQS